MNFSKCAKRNTNKVFPIFNSFINFSKLLLSTKSILNTYLSIGDVENPIFCLHRIHMSKWRYVKIAEEERNEEHLFLLEGMQENSPRKLIVDTCLTLRVW